MGCSPQPEAGPRTTIGLMSALPLFWHEDADPAAMLSGPDQSAPLVKALGARHTLKPVDVLDDASLEGLDLLIMAQPRLLQPEELVRLDLWVRNGGQLLVFADPNLAWPSRLPMGDRRRAPLISLLDPLYRHWGLELDAPADDHAPPAGADIAGEAVTVVTPGRWRLGVASGRCEITPDGLLADCPLARGRAILVSDADMLDGRIWAEQRRDGSLAVLALVERLTRPKPEIETGREHLKDEGKITT